MKALDYFFAARPLLLIPVWSVYLICLHYHHELSEGRFDWYDLALLACLSCLFAGAFYINQVCDYESDKINRKCGFLQEGIISRRAMMAAFLIVSLVPLSVAPFFSVLTTALCLQLLVLAYLYSAPPVRLKDRPIGGLFTNAYAHGFVVSLAVMPEMTINNSGLLGWDNPFYFALVQRLWPIDQDLRHLSTCQPLLRSLSRHRCCWGHSHQSCWRPNCLCWF